MENKPNNSILISNKDQSNELNQRIYARNLPSGNLDLLYNFRPQQTKYSRFPILYRDQSILNKNNIPFNTTTMFNAGNDMGPWSGYISNISDESILRNQINQLQRNPSTTYVPNKNSELYTSHVSERQMSNINNPQQPFSYLFNDSTFSNNTTNSRNFRNVLFNNHTRQQLKDGDTI